MDLTLCPVSPACAAARSGRGKGPAPRRASGVGREGGWEAGGGQRKGLGRAAAPQPGVFEQSCRVGGSCRRA